MSPHWVTRYSLAAPQCRSSEQFEPWVHANNGELFARLVELEDEHGTQAPALPEYQMIEQLLLRRGAFDEGRRQHMEHAEAVADAEEEVEEELRHPQDGLRNTRRLRTAIIALALLALLLLALAWLWR